MLGGLMATVLGQLSPGARETIAAVAELAAGSAEVGPPDAPAELAARLDGAAAAHGLPPALLAAVSWVLARHRTDFRADVAAAEIASRRAAAGLTGAVLGWLRSMNVPDAPEVAGRIAGAFAVIQARELDPADARKLAGVFANG